MVKTKILEARLKSTPKVSIVIPVYNVEAYLERCLNSLVKQTFRDFEIIAVDDGSTDGCADILADFAGRYDYITVATKENEGQAQARNLGLTLARGEFLCFVDSDDFVTPDYLQKMITEQRRVNADIVYCYYYFYFQKGDFRLKYPFRSPGTYSHDEALHLLLHDLQVQSLPWNKLFRTKLFLDGDICFPTMCFEDLAIMHRVFDRAQTVAVIDDALYYYIQHAESTLGTMSAKKINDFIRAMAMVRLTLERRGVYEKYRKSYLALTRKTSNWCCYYVLKMHLEGRRAVGCVNNLSRIIKAVRHYRSSGFSAGFDDLPNVVGDPPPRKLEEDYIR